MFKSLGVAQAKNRNKKEGIEMTDQEYMLRAIQLAKKGEGWTNPNPMVGAVGYGGTSYLQRGRGAVYVSDAGGRGDLPSV